MKKKILGLLVATLLAGSTATQASPITWTYAGSVTSILNRTPDVGAVVQEGVPVSISVTFDPTQTIFAPLLPSPGLPLTTDCNPFGIAIVGGCNSRFVNNSVSFTFDYGGIIGVKNSNQGRMFVFNDYDDGVHAAFDGIWFLDFLNGQRVRLMLSGPTDTFTDSPAAGFFPATQPNLSGSFDICNGTPYSSAIQACYADQLQIRGNVPEPATLALVGAALAGVAITRRRRAAICRV